MARNQINSIRLVLGQTADKPMRSTAPPISDLKP